MKFQEFEHPGGFDTAHIAQADASTSERLFLRTHTPTYPALNDQPNTQRPRRIITGARAVWEVVALELEGAALSGRLDAADEREAMRLCHQIRLAVLGHRFHYHDIG
jgi:hypothetical protein